MNIKKIKPDQFRNIIFGIEDSLVSTVGVLFGISTAITDKKAFITAGLVVIGVAGLSMGAGAFLSETSTKELKGNKGPEKPLLDSISMLFSYLFAGFIPLLPYLIMSPSEGRVASVVVSVVALFVLGYIPGKNIKSGLRMAVIAGFAILVGYLIGNFVPLE